MSRLFTTRNIFIAGGVVAVVYLFPRTRKTIVPTDNPLETKAAQRVTDRYSAGGGSNTHLPAVATKLGDPSIVVSSQEKQTGVGTPSFDEKHASQKIGEPGVLEKTFRNATLGNDKGK